MITEVILPALGETMDQARLLRWLKREGDGVVKGEPIVEIETDKANIEVEALTSGVLRKIVEGEGAIVPVGRTIGYLADSTDEPLPGDLTPISGTAPGALQERREEASRATKPTPARTGRRVISPRARRLADRENIDLTLLEGQGTGPGGRVVEADVRRFVAQRQAAEPTAPPSVAVPAGAPAIPVVTAATAAPGDRVVPLVGMRKAIAERMSRSTQSAPHITFDADVDVSGAEAWRARANALRQAQGQPPISLTALIVKVCAWALQRHPWLNATLRDESVILSGEVNVGVAVALDEGLIVPVVRDAARKGVAEIADDLAGLIKRAQSKRPKSSDLSGGTFTVSNLGMYGVDRFTAILNPPEVGILAIGRIVRRLVPGENDAPVAKPMMTVTLSADHRVVDGVTAARFLADVRTGLEDPSLLLL